MMRKTDFRGNILVGADEPDPERVLRDLPDTLGAKLPAGWSVALDIEPRPTPGLRRWESDVMLTIRGPDGNEGIVLVEVKRRLDPKLVPVVVDQLTRAGARDDGSAGIVVATFLSPRTRELLRESGLSFMDATGNLRIALERPALYIETQGASSDPWTRPGERPLRSLKGPTAGRIVRALCDYWPPFRVEQLVELSGTSLGSVARVFAFLDPEGLIERESRGPVTDVKWADLLRRWAEDYSFTRTNRIQTFLEPRGLGTLIEKLKGMNDPYAITGSLAANQVAPLTSPRLATVYVDDMLRTAANLRLRPAETGGNAYWPNPSIRSWSIEPGCGMKSRTLH